MKTRYTLSFAAALMASALLLSSGAFAQEEETSTRTVEVTQEDGTTRITRIVNGKVVSDTSFVGGENMWVDKEDGDVRIMTRRKGGPARFKFYSGDNEFDLESEDNVDVLHMLDDHDFNLEDIVESSTHLVTRLGEGFSGLGFDSEDMRERAEESREISRLDRESRRIAREMKKADDSERRELEEELDSVLLKVFEMKQARTERQIKAMQEKLSELSETHSTRDGARDEVIARRKKTLMGERDRLDW